MASSLEEFTLASYERRQIIVATPCTQPGGLALQRQPLALLTSQRLS